MSHRNFFCNTGNSISDDVHQVQVSDIASFSDSGTWFNDAKSYAPINIIHEDAITHIENIKPKTLIMCYPTENCTAYNVIKKFVELGGKTLIYYGEQLGGKCADDNFFYYLEVYKSEELIPYHKLERWNGFLNVCTIHHLDQPLFIDMVDPRPLVKDGLYTWIDQIFNIYDLNTYTNSYWHTRADSDRRLKDNKEKRYEILNNQQFGTFDDVKSYISSYPYGKLQSQLRLALDYIFDTLMAK